MGNKSLAAGMCPMGPNQLDWIIYKELYICWSSVLSKADGGLYIIKKVVCVQPGRTTKPAERRV